MRRSAGALAVLAAALAVSGCGTPPADLFSVDRSGEDRNAKLRMVVSDGGSVTCNGKQYQLDADRLLTARQLHRDLIPQAELHLELPPGPRAVLSYRAAMEQGTVAFSDTSARQPESFFRLAAFTKDVAESICHIHPLTAVSTRPRDGPADAKWVTANADPRGSDGTGACRFAGAQQPS